MVTVYGIFRRRPISVCVCKIFNSYTLGLRHSPHAAVLPAVVYGKTPHLAEIRRGARYRGNGEIKKYQKGNLSRYRNLAGRSAERSLLRRTSAGRAIFHCSPCAIMCSGIPCLATGPTRRSISFVRRYVDKPDGATPKKTLCSCSLRVLCSLSNVSRETLCMCIVYAAFRLYSSQNAARSRSDCSGTLLL